MRRGVALWLAHPLAAPWLSPELPPLPRALALAALCTGGLLVYAAAALALRAVEWRDVRGPGIEP